MSSTGSSGLLVRAIESLAADDVTDQSDELTRDRLLALLTALRGMQAQVIRQVDAFDARGLSVDDGCRTTRAWLRAFGRLSDHTAGDLVHTARTLRDLPLLAAASRSGELPAEYLRQVTRLARRIGVEPVQRAQPVLAEAATTLDPADFARVCDRLRAHVDPDGDAPHPGTDFARRELVLSPL
jgi:mRNA-degrading endonuclease toxin of MazEF toxin-antitoxin module